ncbi:hypothetical protein J6590_048363 [Homalodisca vitripennis]|nr:hypothetical protein J6590_048363 [Homalodisca vitripennis]
MFHNGKQFGHTWCSIFSALPALLSLGSSGGHQEVDRNGTRTFPIIRIGMLLLSIVGEREEEEEGRAHRLLAIDLDWLSVKLTAPLAHVSHRYSQVEVNGTKRDVLRRDRLEDCGDNEIRGG